VVEIYMPGWAGVGGGKGNRNWDGYGLEVWVMDGWTKWRRMGCAHVGVFFTVQSPYLSSGKGVNDGGQRLVDGWLSLLKRNYSSWGRVMAGPGMDGLGCGWFQLKPSFALQEFACCLFSCCLGGDGGVVGLFGVEVPVLRVKVFKRGDKRMEWAPYHY
jgi:hypothetical protein